MKIVAQPTLVLRMSNIRFKKGVQAGTLHPSIDHALNIISLVWELYMPNIAPVITSLRDGKHGSHSLHYGASLGDIRCAACDIRTRNLSDAERRVALTQLRLYLGKAYDIIDESNHIHVEYDPK